MTWSSASASSLASRPTRRLRGKQAGGQCRAVQPGQRSGRLGAPTTAAKVPSPWSRTLAGAPQSSATSTGVHSSYQRFLLRSVRGWPEPTLRVARAQGKEQRCHPRKRRHQWFPSCWRRLTRELPRTGTSARWAPPNCGTWARSLVFRSMGRRSFSLSQPTTDVQPDCAWHHDREGGGLR